MKTDEVLKEALNSLRRIIAFDSKDYAQCSRDAWIYGIVLGWDARSIKELKAKFSWSDDTIARLRKYRKAVKEIQGDK